MEPAIQATNIIHAFGPRKAVDGMSFTVNRGEVFALLGPNGAGKTTTVRLLNGLYTPTAGEIRVLGLDPARQGQAVRARSGVLTETPALYERLTARQNLEFFGTLAGMQPADLKQRIAELLAFFELEARADDRVGKYSKGMKQRLALARAILKNPPILVLDEATSAVDNETEAAIQRSLDVVSKGRTTIVIAHRLSTVRQADCIHLMEGGRIVESGTHDELLAREGGYAALWRLQTGERG